MYFNIYSYINTNNDKLYKLEKIVSDIERRHNNISSGIKVLCVKMENEICPICLDDLDEGIITSCDHKYHLEEKVPGVVHAP